MIDWAREWALREVCGIDGDYLNDDRLRRCLDALYPALNLIQGEIALTAVREFDLKLDQLHGDVTSVVLQGEYPEYEEEPDDPPLSQEEPPAHPRYGYVGQPDCKQFRVLEIGTLDGMVPLWHRTQDGIKLDCPEGARAVVDGMSALQKHVPSPGCAIVGNLQAAHPGSPPQAARKQFGFSGSSAPQLRDWP